MIVIGVDPDSKASGIAVFKDGKLTDLKSLRVYEFYQFLDNCLLYECPANIEIHIENVCGQNAAFQKTGIKNKMASTAINRSVGKCQQVQIEIEGIADYFGIKVSQHRINKAWKDSSGKKQFEKLTGWAGRSNEDTRSAAYFGFVGISYQKTVKISA